MSERVLATGETRDGEAAKAKARCMGRCLRCAMGFITPQVFLNFVGGSPQTWILSVKCDSLGEKNCLQTEGEGIDLS